MDNDELDALIERWFDENFRGSAVARAGDDAWNAAFAAKEDLKRRLRETLAAPETSATNVT